MYEAAVRGEPLYVIAHAPNPRQAVGLGLALGVLSVRTEGASAALTTTYAPYATFEESIGAVLLSKKVMEPVRRYIEIGQYDPARSNIKYVTNQLRIKKVREACSTSVEGGSSLAAMPTPRDRHRLEAS
jgi:hypothetical protein